MSIQQFYNDLTSKKKSVKNNELHSLYKRPVHETGLDVPTFQVFAPNYYHQADLLFMPTDNSYKYILVVTDVHSHKTDAEPLKSKEHIPIIAAFERIYFKHKILKKPLVITFDSGNEFKNHWVKDFFAKIHTTCRYALPNRHRQQALVERKNQQIGSILHKRMTNQELLTGEPSREWVDDLKPLINVLNQHLPTPITNPISKDPIATEYNQNLLPIGKKVRVKLDYPINAVNEKRLHGTFRSSDIRWDPHITTISNIILKPGFPPMYTVESEPFVNRTKSQLQLVKRNEREPNKDYIRGTPEHYIVKEILDHRIIKVNNRNVKQLLIRWKGFDDPTWENQTPIKANVPKLVKAYLDSV